MKINEYILYHSAGNLYWKDTDFKYLGCNENFLKIAGLNRQKEIVGKTDRDMFLKYLGEEGIKKLLDVDCQVIYNGIEIVCEELGVNQMGEKSIFLTKKLPLRDGRGKIIGLIGTSIDITKQKKSEEEKKLADEELKKTKYQLEGAKLISGSIAHEIRTPLATIKSTVCNIDNDLSEIIAEGNITAKNMEEIKKELALINKKADQSNIIINMLLTKLQSIDFEFSEFSTCFAKDCIKDALSEFSVPNEMLNKINFEGNNDFKFLGNRVLVMHVIMNLLKNSIFFILKAKKGEITIWLEQDKTVNKIHFKDTGTGISKNILPHIFDSFFTTESSTGTGVGLAFIKMVMQSHKGSIDCVSEEGEYTEFILSFPRLDI